MELDFWSCERSKPPKILPKRCQRAGSDECVLVVVAFFLFCRNVVYLPGGSGSGGAGGAGNSPGILLNIQ